MDKIKLIKRSVRCFVLGLLGLIPVLGLPFAIATLVCAVITVHQAKDQFNPAKHYLQLGRFFGLLGFCISNCICALYWYIAAHSEKLFPCPSYT